MVCNRVHSFSHYANQLKCFFFLLDNIELGVDDPDVDEANLNDSSSGSEGFLAKFSPDELFYFFISRNSKQLNAMNKLRLQQTVLNSFVQILNEQNKKK